MLITILKAILMTILVGFFSFNLILGTMVYGATITIICMAIVGYAILALLNETFNIRVILESL